MKTSHSVTAYALVLCAAVFGYGCADNRASIQIQFVCAPPDSCSFSAACEGQYVSWPTLDVATSVNDTLILYLQVENQMPDNGDETLGRLNTNDAHVDEAVVEYDPPVLAKHTRPMNLSVQAASTSVVKVEVIPAGLGATLLPLAGSDVTGKLRLGGYFDDGTRFETGEFPIGVRICSGCAPAACAGGPTCPPDSEGQLPLACVQ